MKRILSPFVLIFTAILCLGWFYAIERLKAGVFICFLMAVPFVLVWALPVLYWGSSVRKERPIDHMIHVTGYLSMAFLSFFMLFLLSLDAFYFILKYSGQESLAQTISQNRGWLLYGLTLFALMAGLFEARTGPSIRKITIPFHDLPEALDGLTLAQITDLHIGPTIHADYVQKVVDKTLALSPDLIVITGDLVDGSVEKLFHHATPLRALGETGRAYFTLGNHDYYSGAHAWTQAVRELGFRVLINEHVLVKKDGDTLLLAGVTDPAAAYFDPDNAPSTELALQRGEGRGRSAFKVLLAHNPRLARAAAKAGFDLQLSGHTHAGQFVPWTWVVKLVHSPHYWGLSQEGNMKVYVGAGTGTWGPPVRFGTRPELTLITLSKHH